MEGLSLLMEEAANNNPLFAYHSKRSPLKLTHLCFANDLLPFSAASVDSIKVIKRVLDDFEGLAGLRANPAKSSIFCGGVSSGVEELLDFLQMQEGKFPIRYLGVPLIFKRLKTVDCDALVSKIAARIDSWLARNLSFAGRL
jgi:hypothetical protein